MRFLHLIRPVMCVLPEVASPDRKVRKRFVTKNNMLDILLKMKMWWSESSIYIGLIDV